jgi:4,5-DOPA dioxygenase extradiol
MRRRDLLRGLLAAPLAGSLAAACNRASPPTPTSGAAGVMPAIFVAHGSPLLLDDATWVGQLGRWAAAMPRPTAVLMISAHWEAAPLTLGAITPQPVIHDFAGFPDRYARVEYAAPGAPALAERVAGLLAPLGEVWDQPHRGLDHGAYVPLVAMYPKADVPVLQISLPSLEPRALVALGRALAPLRAEGVLIVGSGFLTHNMYTADLEHLDAPTPAWAHDFDAWCADALARRDVDALLDYRARAPAVAYALPTHEHFAPVLVTLGASLDRVERATFPIEGWMAGTFTKRSLQLG